ncbi:MAG: hypothetical protein ABEJ95_07725 [Candidatus Nanohalobium sp.]
MAEKVNKEFKLDGEDVAELLRDVADALEEKDQLNMEFGDTRLIQPFSDIIPLRVFQDENGTEIGFKLQQ